MNIVFRQAIISDLARLIELLNDDDMGKQRESLDPSNFYRYEHAFDLISKDSNAQIIVAERDRNIVATAQLNFLTHLSRQGGVRAHIESVRVSSEYRGQGIGKQLIKYIIQLARNHNCYLVQLTTDKQRTRAIRFYESLGFTASHEGMKLVLG